MASESFVPLKWLLLSKSLFGIKMDIIFVKSVLNLCYLRLHMSSYMLRV